MIHAQTFFFDFDGVIADSVEVKTKAFAKMFAEFGPEIEAKVVHHHRNHGGMSRFDKFHFYYENFLQQPLSQKIFKELCNTFTQLVFEEVVDSPEIPGAEAFLKHIYRTTDCHIISATPDREIREIVKRRGLKKYFKEILGAPTSKTDNIQNLLKKYALIPDRCCFFGDAASDYKAAQETGIKFIGILSGPEAPLLRVAPHITWDTNFLEMENKIECS